MPLMFHRGLPDSETGCRSFSAHAAAPAKLREPIAILLHTEFYPVWLASAPALYCRRIRPHSSKEQGLMSREELDALINPESVARLVVFDPWTANCDRYPPDLTLRKPNY